MDNNEKQTFIAICFLNCDFFPSRLALMANYFYKQNYITYDNDFYRNM